MRIYLTKEQEDTLQLWCRAWHDMYNFLVAKYKDADRFPDIGRWAIKDYKEDDIIRDTGYIVPKRLARNAISRYVYALKRFYSKQSNVPKFHKYNPNKQSCCLETVWEVHDNSYVSFPKVGPGGDWKTRPKIKLDEYYIKKYNIKKIKNPKFTCYKGKWYLSGTFEADSVSKSKNKEVLGLDWGIKTFMTSSKGEFINYPDSIKREFMRIATLQRIRSRKRPGSNNYKKMTWKIGLAYDRMRNLKKDFVEKKTTELCKVYNIGIEDISDLMHAHGFIRRHNAISPWFNFVQALKWKCEKFGGYLICVEPNDTSRTCCVCGKIHYDMTVNKRTMICDCGNIMDRDINAAINIKRRAEAKLLKL